MQRLLHAESGDVDGYRVGDVPISVSVGSSLSAPGVIVSIAQAEPKSHSDAHLVTSVLRHRIDHQQNSAMATIPPIKDARLLPPISDQLRKMAERIQERAIRRCGELLKQIQSAHGANQNIRDDAVPKVTRTSVATTAGLSNVNAKPRFVLPLSNARPRRGP